MLANPQKFLKSLPDKPGVYQMYDVGHNILYVGKAKSLKKRLRNYFSLIKDAKTSAFMAQVKDIEIIITANENAALLLESNLIKTLKPRYNILFKDDKSFPYILLSEHDFPRLGIYRGPLNKVKGKLFGPFPGAKAVHFTLNLLQRIFRLRICSDNIFYNRSRPCMLYQIKLCNAPCVGYVDKATYESQVKLVEQFLNNKSDHIVKSLTKLIDEAATKLDYEQAANYRDQISSIRKVQTDQSITKERGNYDVVALVINKGVVCLDVLFVRNGLLLGNKPYFPAMHELDLSPEEILLNFLMQHYLQSETDIVVPDRILVNGKLKERLALSSLLSEKFKRKIVISDQIKGAQKDLITMAEANARNALKTDHDINARYFEQLLNFKKTFHLSALPRRIECFDVSHMMGEAQIAACVVFNENGPSKSDYRRFNIKTTNVGDDYGALREVLLRRYREQKNLPDLIMVDGGKGQLHVAEQVLQELQIHNIVLLAIAKGVERKPGLEEIYVAGKEDPIILSPQSQALHFIQQIRDEAHRFAISGHRKKMLKLRRRSVLDNVFGLGKVKQIQLLKHFGGLAELRSAGIDDLLKVKGIGPDLARRIYAHLHAE